jgi:purine-binding chemotaxis protein CheW
MTTLEKKVVTQLVEQELALKVYLDSLLFEELPVKEETVVTAPPATEVNVAEPQAAVAQHPEWSEGTFDTLLFKVGGFLTLSVPLVRLNSIVPWPGKLTAVPGYADWFLGLLSNRGRQVKVIDIAKFVIPESHKARSTLESGERQFKHIIMIDDGEFGVAIDELGTVLKLSQEAVRWRHDRSTRPWLAGTVIEQMCALIDIDHFVAMLKEGVPADDITEEH